MSRLSRAAGLVSSATLVSRIFGLGRDAVRATLIGAGRLSDALDVAFKIPNLLRDLFAEGAFSGAFVPTLAREKERGGKTAAFHLLNRVLSTMLVYVGVLVALLIAFAPQIVSLLTSWSPGQSDFRFEHAVRLVRVLAPFLLLICMAVASMGALNVCGRFFVPALSPALQNVVLVGGGLGLLWAGVSHASAALPWALLLLLGGAMQFLVQVPVLRREGWRFRFAPDLRLRSPQVREILRRMAPVAIGLAATHISILINIRLATREIGGPSYLYYGFRLVHLPVGLVGVAVGTVALAEASHRAAQGDSEGVRKTLGDALRLSLAFSIPAAVGLAVLAHPIARLLYGWGHTGPGETANIADAIRFYSAAVVFYASVKVVVPVFYAVGRIRIPMVATFFAVGANVAVALSLYEYTSLAWRSLALAVAAGQAANLAVLLFFAARLYGRPPRRALGALLKIVFAAGVCAIAAYGVLRLLPSETGRGLLLRLERALVPIAAGAVAYFATGALAGSKEIRAVLRRVRLDKLRRPA